jgi:hypothetical protein
MVVAAALAAAFLLGCDRGDTGASSKAPTTAPTTASGGASAGASKTGPAGDTSARPPAANTGGTSSADAKPDPGDANDHSNPQHDAKSKKRGD